MHGFSLFTINQRSIVRYIIKRPRICISVSFYKKIKKNFQKKNLKKSFVTFISKLTDPKSPIKGIGTDTYKRKMKKKRLKKNLRKKKKKKVSKNSFQNKPIQIAQPKKSKSLSTNLQKKTKISLNFKKKKFF